MGLPGHSILDRPTAVVGSPGYQFGRDLAHFHELTVTILESFGYGGDSPGVSLGAGPGLLRSAAKETSTALSTFRETTAGETFLHYGYSEHAAGFAGGLRPGGYATTASELTGAEARAGLALPHATPPNAAYTVSPAPGTLVRVNPVAAPKFGQIGGLPEFQFPFGTGPGTVSVPRTLP